MWPHDTAIVLSGLASVAAGGGPAATQAGAAANRLLDGLLSAAESFDYRLPELYGGQPRTPHGRPLPHPGACHPQAWAATASVAVLQAVLGIAADVPGGQVRVRPLAGAPVGELDVAGLSVAGAAVRVRLDGPGSVEVTGLPDGLVADVGAAQRVPAPRTPSGEQQLLQ